MPRRPPTTGQFKPGNTANPLGAGAHNQELKKVRKLSLAEVEEMASLVLDANKQKIQEIIANPDSSALRLMIAAVANKAIAGDTMAMNAILDRVIGRVAEKVQLTGANDGPITVAPVRKSRWREIPSDG